MRFKQANIKEVDGKWMCTECLTRYNSTGSAFRCAEEHNTKIVRDAKKMMEELWITQQK